MSDPFKNRRKNVRIYRSFILTYYPVSNPTIQRDVSQINNISQGGMNFSATTSLKIGEQVAVELKTPFLAQKVHLQGKVLECREKISNMIYEIRLEFNSLSEQAKEILLKVQEYDHKET